MCAPDGTWTLIDQDAPGRRRQLRRPTRRSEVSGAGRAPETYQFTFRSGSCPSGGSTVSVRRVGAGRPLHGCRSRRRRSMMSASNVGTATHTHRSERSPRPPPTIGSSGSTAPAHVHDRHGTFDQAGGPRRPPASRTPCRPAPARPALRRRPLASRQRSTGSLRRLRSGPADRHVDLDRPAVDTRRRRFSVGGGDGAGSRGRQHLCSERRHVDACPAGPAAGVG